MQAENQAQTTIEEKHAENIELLVHCDPIDLASNLTREHPQTIVMIIATLSHTSQATKLLNELSEPLKADVFRRILHLQAVPSGVQVEVIEAIAAEQRERDVAGILAFNGVQVLARMLQAAEEADAAVIVSEAEATADSSISKLLSQVQETMKRS